MDKQFVSRGGIKLQAALDQFGVEVKDKVVLDVGSSTGGFVDCLLQNGASKVYSVDTSYGELAWKLRNDPRVVVMERTNILHLTHLPGVKAHLEGGSKEDTSDGGPEQSRRVDLITIDAGWTKLELVLLVVKKFLKPGGIIIALLKPHYESEKGELIKGVVPLEKVENIKDRIVGRIQSLGRSDSDESSDSKRYKVEQVMESPVLGGSGNKEFLLKIR